MPASNVVTFEQFLEAQLARMRAWRPPAANFAAELERRAGAGPYGPLNPDPGWNTIEGDHDLT